MATVCPMCGTAYEPGASRCPSCGLYLRVARGNPFTQASLWAMVGGLVMVYALTLLVVALAH